MNDSSATGKSAWLRLVILAILASIAVIILTPWGVEVSHDGVLYLAAAEGLLTGRGISWISGEGAIKPLTHFPPLYPSLLAAIGFTGLDIVFAARMLAAALIGINVFLTGWIVARATRSEGWSLFAALLVLTSPVLLRQHLRAMSEAPFMAFSLLWLMSLGAYLRRPSHRRLLVACAAVSGALLTRYIGVSLVAATGIALLLLGSDMWWRRFGRAAGAMALAYLPIVPWYIRNWALTGNATNRVLIFHPPEVARLKQGVASMSAWLLPEQVPLWVRLGFLGFMGILVLGAQVLICRLQTRGKASPQDQNAIHTLALALVGMICYGAVLIASLTFFDAATPIDNRLLSPIYLLALIYGLVSLWLVQRRIRLGHGFALSLGLAGAALVALNLARSAAIGEQMRGEGAGFTARRWRTSETVDLVRRLPDSVEVYTNEMLGLSFLAGRPVFPVPEKIDPVKAQERAGFPEALAAMREDLLGGEAILVIFPPLSKMVEMPSLEEVAGGLSVYQETSDAQIYAAPGFEPLP